MELRYFQTYDANGVDSAKELQFWDEEFRRWMPVYLIRCSEDEEEAYLKDRTEG